MATTQVAPQPPHSPVGPTTYAVESPSASRRQYQQQSPRQGDNVRAQSIPRTSPQASRRPSRQTSASTNAETAAPNLLQNPLPPAVPLGQGSPIMNRSPAAASAGAAHGSAHPQGPRGQRDYQSSPGGPPISPPPRTSSTQHDQRDISTPPAASPGRVMDPSNEPAYAAGSSTNPRSHGDPYTKEETAGPSSASSRSRKRGPATQEGPQRAASVREGTSQRSPRGNQNRATMQVTTSPAASPRPNEPQVINRTVIDDDPTVDLRREEERQMESIPGLAVTNNVEPIESARPAPRTRPDPASNPARRKEAKFGDYILGQTLGEGEFGKVKLGWKKDGSVQVAIKLIRQESLGSNPSRLPKIQREISILQTLQHPNIVKLHEMVKTRDFIGIILEYASGGELFDYILNHRYLKDHTARKLFAQLVSGVGYLHKKGIVHRDLKLENLLLDRNRNIIITDFGFANTFNPSDELGEEIENNLTSRDYVKRMNLDRVHNGVRRGDLMATSCGSPCYAAPELVVTDSLYTGRKVDVWSCGVILYAMLAGYLPFDDDPANPEGDNINLLYKYITSTPLTFPEYVTPHARDLLRRILVPDPRKRADLFEVARHSWLSDYAHVVAQVTSSATTVGEISNATVVSEPQQEAPPLVRSASVREPARAAPVSTTPTSVGGIARQGPLDLRPAPEDSKTSREAKRRTVQVEYVAPTSQTVRGEGLSPIASPGAEEYAPVSSAARAQSRGKAEGSGSARQYDGNRRPPQSYHPQSGYTSRPQTRPGSSSREMAPPDRPPKEYPRSTSDSTGAFVSSPNNRPATGSSTTTPSHSRLPSRGNSYSLPLAPTVATTNAQGRVTQPKTGSKQYNISAPIPQVEPYSEAESIGRPSAQAYVPPTLVPRKDPPKGGHKRSNTFGNFFRTGSISGPRSIPQSPDGTPKEKRYPPTSMRAPIANETPRQSTDSRRPSFGIGRKGSDTTKSNEAAKPEKSRRFSLLPASFSFKSFTSTNSAKEEINPASTSRQSSNFTSPAATRTSQRPQTFAYTSPTADESATATNYDGPQDRSTRRPASGPASRPDRESKRYRAGEQPTASSRPAPQPGVSSSETPGQSQASLGRRQPQPYRPVYPPGFGAESYGEDDARPATQGKTQRGPGVLQKNNRRFADAYEQDQDGHHAGSSGAARRVMDFFRRRGKARAEERA